MRRTTIIQKTGGGSSSSLGTFTWANRPSAAVNNGKTAFFSDVGDGMMFISSGARWRPLGLNDIAWMEIPAFIVPSGTMANNGVVTFSTNLGASRDNGIYAYFPANAIYTGSAAGLYYTIVNGTSGTIYNNIYTSGPARIPSTLIPFVCTGPGAYTQTIDTDITVMTVKMNGGLLKNLSSIKINILIENAANANTKTFKIVINSQNLVSQTATSTSTYNTISWLLYKSNSTIQRQSTSGGIISASVGGEITGLTLENDTTISFVLRVSNSLDWVSFSQINVLLGMT